MREESFRLLVESEEVRIGVRSSGPERGIEVLVRLVPAGSAFDPGHTRSFIDCLEALIDLGFGSMVHEGSWVVCERTISEEEMTMEVDNVLDLFLDLLPPSKQTGNETGHARPRT